MLLRMLGKDTSSVDEQMKLYEGGRRDRYPQPHGVAGRGQKSHQLLRGGWHGYHGQRSCHHPKAHRYPRSRPTRRVRHDPAGVLPLQRYRLIGEADRTAVFTRYQLSVEKSEHLTDTWTLEKYERCYERAFYSIVESAAPDWKPGQRFDPSLLDGVTRQSVEQQIVPADGRTLTLTSGGAIDVRA